MTLISVLIQVRLIHESKVFSRIETGKSFFSRTLLRLPLFLQYLLVAILILLLIEIFAISGYHVFVIKVATSISLSASAVILGVLSSRFAYALKHSRGRVVGAYMMASGALAIYNTFTLLYILSFLQNKPDFITADYNPGLFMSVAVPPSLFVIYQLLGVISFVSMWFASIFLADQFAFRSRRIWYWIVMSLPFLYFIGPFLMYSFEDTEPIMQFRKEYSTLYADIYNLLLNTSKVGGIILFGIVFLLLSKTLPNPRLKSSVIMTGIGLVFLYGINVSSLVILSMYPPWGILSITYLLSGSYLLMIGLDSAAFFVATDSSLRRIVQKSPERYLDIVKSLGQSKVQDLVMKKINGISKSVYDEIEHDNLFRVTFEEDNIQNYVMQVLEELHQKNVNLSSDQYKRDRKEDPKDW